jgi:hypothetical protein
VTAGARKADLVEGADSILTVDVVAAGLGLCGFVAWTRWW